MLTVHDLTPDQLDELKNNLFWSDEPQPLSDPQERPILFPCDIPDAFIFDRYAGYVFSNDDFRCTAGRQKNMDIYSFQTIRVNLDHIGLSGAYVLILPNPNQHANFRDFILAQETPGICVHMFGMTVDDDDEAINFAIEIAPSYAREVFDGE